MRYLRALGLVALVISAAGLLAACGGGGGGSDQSASQVIEQTFSGKKDVKSANIDLSFELRGKGDPSLEGKPVRATFKGPFESQGKSKLPKFDFTIAVNAAGQSFNAGATSTGDKGFLKFQGTNYAVDDSTMSAFTRSFEDAQKQGGGAKGGSGLGALGIDPSRWLKNPENLGEADVAGAKTIHIRSGVDIAKLLDDFDTLFQRARKIGADRLGSRIPAPLTPKSKREIASAIKDPKFEVWTGKDDKVLRKLSLSLQFVVPEDRRKAANQLESGDLSLNLTLGDLNENQEIAAPKNAKPLSELLSSGLGGLLGAGGGGLGSAGGGSSSGGSSGGGSSGGTSSAPNPKNIQRYSQCLQEAKSPQELQDCSKVLQ